MGLQVPACAASSAAPGSGMGEAGRSTSAGRTGRSAQKRTQTHAGTRSGAGRGGEEEKKRALAGRSKPPAGPAGTESRSCAGAGRACCWHCPRAPVPWHGEDYSPAGVRGGIAAVPASLVLRVMASGGHGKAQACVQNGSSSNLGALFRMKGAVPRLKDPPRSGSLPILERLRFGPRQGSLFPREWGGGFLAMQAEPGKVVCLSPPLFFFLGGRGRKKESLSWVSHFLAPTSKAC